MFHLSSPAPPLSPSDFTMIVNQHQGAIYSFLYGLVGDREQARDLTQDTFYDAWQAARQGQTPFVLENSQKAIRSWLFQAAYHRAISLLRRNRLIRFESLEVRHEQEPDHFTNAASFETAFAEREALQRAMANLTPPDVACLLLRVVYGFSAALTGEIIGTSPDTINKRLSRAKQRLRAAYFAQEEQQTPRRYSRKDSLR